ncbi:MAG TPA: FliH/SctL family protein [Phycisphaerae bacterium]|nr:FliH/SctL family protein [Phycisphaerae bacterium]
MTATLTCRVAALIGSVRVLERLEGGPASAPPRPDPDGEHLRRQVKAERDQLAQARGALASAATGVAELEGRLIRQAERQMLELALEIAARVLCQEIRAARPEIAPIVAEALRRVPSDREVVIHLHPDDLACCRQAQEADEPDGEGAVRFVADPAVPRAGCVIETAEGVVESTVEGNLQRLGEALRGQE